MPVLRQRFDGGYYIRGLIPGTGRFATWQVTPNGVALLQRIGITDGGEIPGVMLRELRDRGLVYTFGSGLGQGPVVVVEKPAAPSPDPLALLLREDEVGWHLHLVLPALPKSFLTRFGVGDSVLDALEHCGFRVDGRQIVGGWRLWPGRGDAACIVGANEDRYTVEPVGSWPDDWDLTTWTRGADGLSITGNLFAGPELGDLRLSVGEPIVPDKSYYFVSLDDPANQFLNNIVPIPDELTPRVLPAQVHWKAWEIHVPSVIGEHVRDWCLRIGHPVGVPCWRLELISPPPSQYSASGLPILEGGCEAIVGAYPPVTTEVVDGIDLRAERDGSEIARLTIQPTGRRVPPEGPRYFALPITEEGVYRVRAASGRVVPVTFVAASAEPRPELPHLTFQPAPLEVAIAGKSSELRLRAFIDGSGPHEISLTSLGGSVAQMIAVKCPTPIDISWSCGQVRGQRPRVQPSEVHDLLAGDLSACLADGRPFPLRVDAGSFGVLLLHIRAAQSPQEGAATRTGISTPMSLSPNLARRARWLAVAIPALLERGDVATVRLTSDIRDALAKLESLPEALALGQIPAIPRHLLPHLKALAHAAHQGVQMPLAGIGAAKGRDGQEESGVAIRRRSMGRMGGDTPWP